MIEENHQEGGVRWFIRERLWWWPAVVGLYCLFGLVLLYWYSEEIFQFMTAENAAKYLVVSGTLLVALYIFTMILFLIRHVRRRRAREEREFAKTPKTH